MQVFYCNVASVVETVTPFLGSKKFPAVPILKGNHQHSRMGLENGTQKSRRPWATVVCKPGSVTAPTSLYEP